MKRRVVAMFLAAVMGLSMGANVFAESDADGEGGISVVCAANAEVSEVNPYVNSGISVCYKGYIFQTLGYAEGRGSELEGVLAESWEETGDQTYEIHLYEGITDSAGNPITAEDVVAAYEWMKSSGVVSKMSYLDSISVIDDLTVEMKLATDTLGALQSLLTQPIVSIEAAEEVGGDYQKVQIGSGPYAIGAFESGSYLTLVKRSDYWKTEDLTAQDEGTPDEITFQYIASSAQLSIAMENKEIDGIIYFSGSDARNFIDEEGNALEGYTVASYLDPNTFQLFCNMSGDSALSDDLALRQAIFTAINPEEILDGALDNLGSLTHDYANSVYPDYNTEWDDEPYFDYDLDAAKELLASSSYDGSTLKIASYNFSPNTDIVTILQQELAAAGINAEIVPVEQAQADDVWNTTTDWDLFLVTTLSMDYAVNCYTYFLDANNYTTGLTKNGWYDEEFQSLLDTAKSSETNSQEAVDAVHDYLIDQAVARGVIVQNYYSVWQDGIEEIAFNYNGYPTVKQFKFASDYVSNAD